MGHRIYIDLYLPGYRELVISVFSQRIFLKRFWKSSSWNSKQNDIIVTI